MAAPIQPMHVPVYQGDSATVYLGDAGEVIAGLPDHSVDCCVTSPPYWGLRDYDLPPVVWGGDPDCQHRWGCPGRDARAAPSPGRSSRLAIVAHHGSAAHNSGRFCLLCGAWLGSLGLEPTPELYVEHLVDVFRQLRRVLKPTGTLWLNLGDSYFTRSILRDRGNRDVIEGFEGQALPEWRDYVRRGRVRYSSRHATLKDKDLVGVPWRVALALQADGWYLRSDVIWAKPNPMPESVRDRPTRAHDHLFLLSIGRRYYYDAEAVREPCVSGPSDIRKMIEGLPRIGGKHKDLDDRLAKASAGTNIGRCRSVGHPSGRNRRSIWTVASQPYRGAHFASFPAGLVEPCVLAGTSERGCCRRCGAPWERARKAAGWRPGCGCGLEKVAPSVVIDPFAGSGTTLAVAARLGRSAVGIELNPDYIELIKGRLLQPMRDGASMTPASETKEAA